MRSKMTEKEFRERLSQPYGPEGGAGVMTPVEHAVFLAREAGLEFAPAAGWVSLQPAVAAVEAELAKGPK